MNILTTMSTRLTVPFLDLKSHYRQHQAAFDGAMGAVIAEAAFVGGPWVEQFEAEFAAYCGTTHAVGVANGTVALWMALLAMGIGPGDEVITVPNSFIATAEAISFCGAKPVFVDVREADCNMDPSLLKAAISSRTKAILPVHLFGHPANMEAILTIAQEHGLPVVEDAAQAHGARYHGKMAGSMGLAGCFSFHPVKNLGAFGEAGAVITNDGELAQKLRRLRDHGQFQKYHHEVIGWNGRMDGLQAAVLSTKLPFLEERNSRRRQRAGWYFKQLDGIPDLVLPASLPEVEHAWHQFPVRIPRRDEILAAMQSAGIGCGIHYPVPIHRQKAYHFLGLSEGSFPVAERCSQEFLSLPIFPELTEEQVLTVAGVLRGCLKSCDNLIQSDETWTVPAKIPA